MPEHKTQSEASIEDTLPVGSIDKSRAESEDPDEQYPIPSANPDPFREE